MIRAQLRRDVEIARARHDEAANVTDAFKTQLRKRIDLRRGEPAISEAREQVAAAEAAEVLAWQEWNMLREALAADAVQIGAAR